MHLILEASVPSHTFSTLVTSEFHHMLQRTVRYLMVVSLFGGIGKRRWLPLKWTRPEDTSCFVALSWKWSSVLNNRALVLRVILSMYAPFVEFALEVNRRQICKLTIDVFATIHQRGKHQLTVRQYVVKKLHFSEPVGPVQSRPTVRR